MITVDSFGSNCPDNWQTITDWLNEYIEASGADEEEAWEDYCAGRLEDVPEAR